MRETRPTDSEGQLASAVDCQAERSFHSGRG